MEGRIMEGRENNFASMDLHPIILPQIILPLMIRK